MVICLERGADLHMAQLMPLPLTVSCFSKIRIGFTFLVLAHLGSPGKGPLNGCVWWSYLSNECLEILTLGLAQNYCESTLVLTGGILLVICHLVVLCPCVVGEWAAHIERAPVLDCRGKESSGWPAELNAVCGVHDWSSAAQCSGDI